MIFTGTNAKAVAVASGWAVSVGGGGGGGVKVCVTFEAACVFSGVENMLQNPSVAVIATAAIAN
jgi:hypothetical protein